MQTGAEAGQIAGLQRGVTEAAASGRLQAANLSASMAAQEKAAILSEARKRRADKLAVVQAVFAPKAKPEETTGPDATGLLTLFGGSK